MAANFVFFLLPFLLFSKSNSQTIKRPNDEHQILLRLKQAWGNPPALDTWNSTTSVTNCNWAGVRCTNGMVTSISLTNQNLKDPIPPSICLLKNLSYLDLSYNNISSPFPTALYSCSNLQHLDISQNAFVGRLPADINRLSPRLVYLSLAVNNFSGDVPASVGQFAELKSLHLDTNHFNGSYPAEIGNLSALENLTLAYNPFAPARIPPEFGNLTRLNTAWMSNMNIIGEIPEIMSKLTEVKVLSFSTNALTGTIPRWVWQLQKLEELYLFDNKLTGQITDPIGALNLTQIDVSANELTGAIPEDFGKLKKLNALVMYYNKLSGTIPASIGLLPMLFDVRLFNNNLSGILPPELGKHSMLNNLEVDDNNLSGQLPEFLCSNGALTNIVVFNNHFSGELPASLARCYTLDDIQLYNNHFTGDVPPSIWTSMRKLTTVLIHDNALSGTLPTELGLNISRIEMENNRFTGTVPSWASRLQVFKAANNLFTGEIPRNLTGMQNLTDLDLSGNQISGTIPPEIGMLQSLNTLNLSGNKITGEIPATLGSLQVLTTLDLSDNQLTGEIPPDFSNLRLNFLNLSRNKLTGEIPASLQIQAYDTSFFSNPGLCVAPSSIPRLRTCGSRLDGHDQLSKSLIILISMLAGVVLLGMAVIGFLILRWHNDHRDVDSWKLTSFHRHLELTEYDIVSGIREENLIGSGGSGKVYRLCLGDDSEAGRRMVAVKKIWNGRKLDAKLEKEFESEVEILGAIRHANIVKLLCCVSSSDSKLLVYEYMENGSLDRWLHHRERVGAPAPLEWPTRLGIAMDAARGLCYMHHDCSLQIVHRDVKSSNILLDPEFRAKIADFGLARMLTSGGPESVSAIGGTFGYMPPECGYSRKVNEKVDVYSFGVVLLELTTGRVANDGGADCCLAEWAWRKFQDGQLIDAVDKDIQDTPYLDDVLAVFTLGVICTGGQPLSRPSMKAVLHYLTQYERTPREANSCHADCAPAPLLQSKKGSRRKSLSDAGQWRNDDEDSGSFVVHAQ